MAETLYNCKNVISEPKRKVLIKTSFCPLLLVFCGQTLNRQINRLHERALRIACENYESSFEELLSKDGSVTIQRQNLRVLAIEIYKVTKKLYPKFILDLVEEIDTKYHTRSSCKIDINEYDEIKYTKSQITVFIRRKIKTSIIRIAWT